MTLDEAIQHCKEVAKESKEAELTYARENAYETAISCKACGQEHEQLAKWLEELKQRREAEPVVRCGECRYMEPNGHCTQFADDHIRPSVSDFCSAGERRY